MPLRRQLTVIVVCIEALSSLSTLFSLWDLFIYLFSFEYLAIHLKRFSEATRLSF